MRWLHPELQYQRDGPFYGLVLAYLCQVHGFIELASRGLALRFAKRTPRSVFSVAESRNSSRSPNSPLCGRAHTSERGRTGRRGVP